MNEYKKKINMIFGIFICVVLFIGIFSNMCQANAVTVGTQDEWLMAIEGISEEILSDGDWIYSNSGTKKSYQKARKNCHKTNCALFVSHALQYFGVFGSNMTFYGDEDGLKYSGTTAKSRLKSIAEITEYDKNEVLLNDIKDDLQAGDIITFYKVHTCIYLGDGRYATAGKSSTDTGKDGGTIVKISKTSPGCSGYISSVIRLKYSTEVSSSESDSDEETTSSAEDTEAKTFSGALGSTFRQIWVFLATLFENHANETDEETVLYNLGTASSAGAGNGDILASCEAVMNLVLPTDSYYSQATPPLIRGDIEKQFNTATTTKTGICCTTYVAMVLYYSGVLTADQINACNYHYGESLTSMLVANGWKEVSVTNIQPGDVVRDPGVHTFIYAGDGQIWDECCCITSSSGNPPNGTTRSRSVSGCKVYRAP